MSPKTWFRAMEAAGQYPLLFDPWGEGHSAQVEVAGRRYDHCLDRTRWAWMRRNEDDIRQYLLSRDLLFPPVSKAA